MEASNNFKIEEQEISVNKQHMYGTPVVLETTTHYKIIRNSDKKVIKVLYDYLEALKYLDGLEDRAWLVC